MPKKQQKMASNKKKQTHSKIQFDIEIQVTKFEKIILLNSTCPIV